MNWAVAAYKIDSSKPISQYYEYFLDRYNVNSDTLSKDNVFEDKPIDV